MSDDEAPKSAVELAMERLRARGDFKEVTLSDKQKAEIAEVRSLYKAKTAEFEIQHDAKMSQAASLEELEAMKTELVEEKSRLNEEMERKVRAIREQP